MAISAATAAIIGTIATVGSTVLSVGSSIVGAASQAEAAQQSKEIAERNKAIAKQNAELALVTAQEEQLDQDMLTLAQLGEQKAQQGASGLRLESPSFVMTRAAAKALGRQDALNVREAGEIRAQAYRNESDAFAAESLAASRAKKNAVLGGFLGVGSSLIGGASQFARTAPNRTNNYMTVPSPVLY